MRRHGPSNHSGNLVYSGNEHISSSLGGYRWWDQRDRCKRGLHSCVVQGQYYNYKYTVAEHTAPSPPCSHSLSFVPADLTASPLNSYPPTVIALRSLTWWACEKNNCLALYMFWRPTVNCFLYSTDRVSRPYNNHNTTTLNHTRHIEDYDPFEHWSCLRNLLTQ